MGSQGERGRGVIYGWGTDESLSEVRVFGVSAPSTRSHLKVHGDGRPGPLLLVVGRQEFDLGADLRLLHPGHAFDPADTRTQRGESAVAQRVGFKGKGQCVVG